jgi:PAS domain S-box-containing protein
VNDPARTSPGSGWCQTALSAIADAVVAADPDGHVTHLNDVAERLLGVLRGDTVGRPVEELLRFVDDRTGDPVPDPSARVLREAARVTLTGEGLALVRDDCTRRAVLGAILPVASEYGGECGLVAMLQDVTTRRDAERDLRLAEQGFRLLVESTQDYAIFMLDPLGRVVTWNVGAQRIKGYRRDEILGRHFSVFYPPEAVATGWPDAELRYATERGRFEDEGWRIRKDGTRFWANVVITALRDDHGRLWGFSKITRDLSERRAAEDAVRSREARLRAIAESASDAIVVFDDSSRVTFWNPAAKRMLGRDEESVLGRPVHEIVPSAHRDTFETEVARLRSPGAAVGAPLLVDLRRRDGREFPVELSLSSWMTQEEERFFCATIRDVTERRQLERARVQAEVMADLDRRKDEFLAMLSHELRNPLAPIVNAVHLLRMQDEDPVQRQARAVIERQVAQITRLLDDLLEVSRALSGTIRVRLEPCDLRRVVRNALETTQPAVEQQRHEISVDLPAEGVWVEGDPARLEQVAVNLIANASKYTPPGGRIEIALRTESDEAVLRVRDNGSGIAADLLPRIFDLFTQGERALDRAQGGLGIGLTVVKKVVELHHGTVTARSEGVGRGSEFVVRLQLTPAPGDHASENAAPPKPWAARRILVVDDNRDSAEMTAALLQAHGHAVRTAFDGGEALARAGEFRPDAILLDIGLPGLDGYEVARRVRSDPAFQGVRLIAVSGYGQQKDRDRSSAAGFDAHLVKPVDPQAVLDLLREP